MTARKVRHARSRPARRRSIGIISCPSPAISARPQHARSTDLAAIGEALSGALGRSVETLWQMRNGYALCHQTGLEAISAHLAKLGPDDLDALRAGLRIGVQTDVEVTDAPGEPRPRVSQAFCSALPVTYTQVPARYWRAFASLVLEAAYEATMWSAVLNAKRGASNMVLLTFLGGGAFGNDDEWILGAMRRGLATGLGSSTLRRGSFVTGHRQKQCSVSPRISDDAQEAVPRSRCC